MVTGHLAVKDIPELLQVVLYLVQICMQYKIWPGRYQGRYICPWHQLLQPNSFCGNLLRTDQRQLMRPSSACGRGVRLPALSTYVAHLAIIHQVHKHVCFHVLNPLHEVWQ